MPGPTPNFAAEQWLFQLFSAKAARNGGVLRRNVRDVERIVGRAAFEREIARRGYQLIENSGQFLVICNTEPVHMLLGSDTSRENSSKNFRKIFGKIFRPCISAV